LRALADRLAGAGFHALRFDCRGCGDSGGEGSEAGIDEWVEDALAAVSEMREHTGSSRVALVGLRLGAALGTLAARRLGGVDSLVLWDPVVDGTAYVRELRVSNATWIREHAHGAEVRDDEVLGAPFPARLAAEIAAVRLAGLDVPARRALIVSSDEGQGPIALWADRDPVLVERRRFPPAPVWLHAEGEERALVPGELLDAVVAWLAGPVA